jgi:hypothetical protein
MEIGCFSKTLASINESIRGQGQEPHHHHQMYYFITVTISAAMTSTPLDLGYLLCVLLPASQLPKQTDHCKLMEQSGCRHPSVLFLIHTIF